MCSTNTNIILPRIPCVDIAKQNGKMIENVGFGVSDKIYLGFNSDSLIY